MRQRRGDLVGKVGLRAPAHRAAPSAVRQSVSGCRSSLGRVAPATGSCIRCAPARPVRHRRQSWGTGWISCSTRSFWLILVLGMRATTRMVSVLSEEVSSARQVSRAAWRRMLRSGCGGSGWHFRCRRARARLRLLRTARFPARQAVRAGVKAGKAARIRMSRRSSASSLALRARSASWYSIAVAEVQSAVECCRRGNRTRFRMLRFRNWTESV